MNTRKKIVTISIAILFIGVAAFNVHMNAEQNQSLNQSSKVTLQNIAAMTAAAGEANCKLYCCGSCWLKCGINDCAVFGDTLVCGPEYITCETSYCSDCM